MPSYDTDSASEDDNPKKIERVKKSPAAKINKKSSKIADDTAKHNVGFGRGQKMPVLVTDMFKEIDLPELTEFNPDDIKTDATIVAIGKRRTGKTWIFRNIMYLMRDKFQAGIVISQTDELNHFWSQYVPEKYIYKKYDTSILEAVFRRQKRILNDNSLTDEEKEKQAPFFILLDDVISDSSIRYDDAMTELFVAGRHYKLFILITTQYAKAITPTLRANTDYCFIMKCVQFRQVEALWEDFASFVTKQAFAQIIDANTEDNEVLVMSTCPEIKVEPLAMMHWWKAVDPGVFRMGSEEYWRNSVLSTGDSIPSAKEGEQRSMWLTVKDITPRTWQPWFNMGRSVGKST
jgi:hypothetical protein